MDNYIPDYYDHECKLAVEVDSRIHDNKRNREYDESRTRAPNELGITVIRVRNEEVLNNIDQVLEKTAKHFA